MGYVPAMSVHAFALKAPALGIENGLREAPVAIEAAPSITQRPSRPAPLDRTVSQSGGELNVCHLRDRASGFSAPELSAREVLFILLSFLCPEEQARILANRLLDQFGSLGALLKAPEHRLGHLVPDCENLSLLLRSVHRAIALALREPIEERPCIRNPSQLQDYLRVTLSHEENEVVRLLFLDQKNRLLQDELHARGSQNHTPLYPRELVRRVLQVNASALIIVHNHPSGDPTPSNEDVTMTRLLARVLNDINVTLHDHVIVGRLRCYSMRAEGLLTGFLDAG